MKLTKQIKQQIIDEFSEWAGRQYAGKTQEERAAFGQYFTPSELTIKMIEKFKDLDGTILDPCAGCGGLLAACIIAGADPRNIYGIELDNDIVTICRQRLKECCKKYNVHKLSDIEIDELFCNDNNKSHIYQGSALDEWAYDFPEHKAGRPYEPVQLF